MNGVGIILRALAFAGGAGIVAATWQSIIVTIILPRRTRNRISQQGWLITYRVLFGLARRARSLAGRDAILALLGPINIIGLLFTWMSLFVVGFGLVFWAIGGGSFGVAFDLAGSSIFTLGFAAGATGVSHVLMYLAAASGMIVIALQIGYLPTIYGAYTQREALVTLLNMRAQEGGALTGATILANHGLPDSAESLRALFASWEACAAAIVESHTNYPWLIVFRSPRPTESWITSMLAILDAIALLEAVAPRLLSPEAAHCRFACTAALNELARMLRPVPSADFSASPHIEQLEFAASLSAVCEALRAECNPESTWRSFCTSRAGYETAALQLGAFVAAPVAGWLRPVARGASPSRHRADGIRSVAAAGNSAPLE